MGTTIHFINDINTLSEYMLDIKYNKFLRFYGKNMKKKSATNGSIYSNGGDEYIGFNCVDIPIEKYFGIIKCNSIPEPFKKELGKSFWNAMYCIPSDWMTYKIRDTCVSKGIISRGFCIPNDIIMHQVHDFRKIDI